MLDCLSLYQPIYLQVEPAATFFVMKFSCAITDCGVWFHLFTAEARSPRTGTTEPYIISHLFLQLPIGVIVRVRSTTWLSFQRKQNPLSVSHHLRAGQQMESSHLFDPGSYFDSNIFLSLPVTSKAQRCCFPQREACRLLVLHANKRLLGAPPLTVGLL